MSYLTARFEAKHRYFKKLANVLAILLIFASL